MNFNSVKEFEKKIAEWFGSKYAVAVDCCTHGIELCLRLYNISVITVPKRTYLSVPMLANKMNIDLKWKDEKWKDYYIKDNLDFDQMVWEFGTEYPNGNPNWVHISWVSHRPNRKQEVIAIKKNGKTKYVKDIEEYLNNK